MWLRPATADPPAVAASRLYRHTGRSCSQSFSFAKSCYLWESAVTHCTYNDRKPWIQRASCSIASTDRCIYFHVDTNINPRPDSKPRYLLCGVSCWGAGGRGRDFTLTMHSVRGSPNIGGVFHGHTSPAAAKKEPMIRMNSRLGATHPARSKTLSGLGGLGGSSATINMISGGAAAVPGGGGGGHAGIGGGGGTGGGGGGGGGIRGRGGIPKSRTMDLSNHLSSAPNAAAGVLGVRPTSRSLSPPPFQHHGQHQHQRPGTIRQRTWSVSEAEASLQSENDGEGWRTEGGDGARKGTGSLPPLSPRSAAEANRHRDARDQGSSSRTGSRHERHRASRDSNPCHRPRQSIGSSGRERGDVGGDSCRDRDHRNREEEKSPRQSADDGGDGGGDTPRYPSPSSFRGGKAEQDEQRHSWQGWGGSWEGKERDEEDGHRLPPSPRGSSPRERVPRSGVRDSSGDDGEDESGSVHGHRGSSSPSRPQKSSSEGFKLPQSPSA